MEEKPNWRQRVVAWVAALLGVTIYPSPFQIVIYDMTGELIKHYRDQRAEDEGLH